MGKRKAGKRNRRAKCKAPPRSCIRFGESNVVCRASLIALLPECVSLRFEGLLTDLGQEAAIEKVYLRTRSSG